VFSDADIVRKPIIKIIANYPRLDATPIVVKDKKIITPIIIEKKPLKTNFYLFLNKIISFFTTHITIKLVI
jgi:hypothetical protein